MPNDLLHAAGTTAALVGPAPARKLLGQVFTPPAVADLIACLSILSPDATVFDPCAGEGALLLAAGRRLAALGTKEWHRQLHGCEVEPGAWARCRQRLADAAGVSPEEIDVTQGDFLRLQPPSETGRPLLLVPAGARSETGRELWDGAPAGQSAICHLQSASCPLPPAIPTAPFDVALMNPPYTRQERLNGEQKAGAGGRAGLHVRFWMHLADFVRPRGRLGVITSATWLSAGYGRALRAFLLERFRIHALLDFERDVFPDANVEACIAVLEPCPDPSARAATVTHFVRMSGKPPAGAQSETGRELRDGAPSGQSAICNLPPAACRLQSAIPQQQLAREPRWSGFFLPASCRSSVSVAGAVPLAALAQIRRGITTGSNRVFLPDAATAAEWGIEERFLRPFLRSPREIPGLDTAGVEQPARLLLPPGPEDAGTRAAEYLRAQGAGGSRYLPEELPAPAPLLFGYAVRARKAFFRNSAGLTAGDNFFCLAPRRAEDLEVLFALLNALPTAAALELQGRGQGRGLLKIQRCDLAELGLPDPARLDAGLRRELETLGEALRRAPDDAAARAALDNAACRAAGLDAAELSRAERELAAGRALRRSTGQWVNRESPRTGAIDPVGPLTSLTLVENAILLPKPIPGA